MLVKGSLIDLLNILSISNASFFRAIWVSVILTEDRLDLEIEIDSSMTDEKNLEGFFNGNATLEGLIVHEELDKVEELSWFKVLQVIDTSLIHGHKFLL